MKYFPVLLILYEFVANMSVDMYTPAMPDIARALYLSTQQVQLTVTFWLLGFAISALLLGPLSDRFGRRPLMFGGGTLYVLAALLCGVASGLGILLLGRFLLGVSVCAFMLSCYATVNEFYEEKVAIRLLAWMSAVSILAPMIGPLLGGIVLLFAPWRLIFGILFILALAVLIPLWRLMPEANVDPDFEALKWRRIYKVYTSILFNGRLVTAALCYALLYGGVFAWITASPILIIQQLGFTPFWFGVVQLPIYVAFMGGALLVRHYSQSCEKKWFVRYGLLTAFLSIVIMVLWNLFYPKSIYALVLPLTGMALGFGLCSPPLQRIVMTASNEKKGAVSALLYLIVMLLGVFGSYWMSLMQQSPLATSAVVLILVSLALVAYTMHEYVGEKKA